MLICIAFLNVFQHQHPFHKASDTAKFRLRLLKFTVLYTQRFTIAECSLPLEILTAVREKHHERAQALLTNFDVLEGHEITALNVKESLPNETREHYRMHMIMRFSPDKSSSSHYGSELSLSILDTLPFFISLSAAQALIHGNYVTELWMRLAARYMAQAVLEQCLIYDMQGPEILQAAFAYGSDLNPSTVTNSDGLNLSWKCMGRETDLWEKIRKAQINSVSSI